MSSATNLTGKPERRAARNFFFGAILLFLILAIAEGLALAFGLTFGKNLFSNPHKYFRSISAADFETWQKSPWYDPELGWGVPVTPTLQSERNCLGETISYNVHDGMRMSAGSGTPAVALFGESFTYGQEIDDDSTIASALWHRHGLKALNYGAPGYSPEQAVLKFERILKTGTLPSRAILIVMHENIRRTANSFRPAYLSSTDIVFGLKPYMQSGTMVPLISPPDFAAFVGEAAKRFESDFWARPELTFPYTLSLIEAISTNSYYFRNWASFDEMPFTHEYTSDNPLRRNLTAVARRFRNDALAANITPLIIFIPQSKATYGVSASYVKALDQELGGNTVLELDDAEMDWSRYNLKPEGDCHVSPYGAERIAKFISDALSR
ncbi:MAG: hypothetical protein AB7S92_03330 [Parvibaculaceae bacterium]